MKNILNSFLNIFRFHKKKLLFLLISFFLICIFIFPYDDLGDYVAVKVSELTNKQVFLQFEKMGFSLFPQPGLEFKNVYVESAFAPSLETDSITIAPSIIGLLTFKPGVKVLAEGIFNGDLGITTRGGKKTNKGDLQQIININLNSLNLEKIALFAALPVPLKGALSGDSNLTVDPQFIEQPEGEITLESSPFKLPPSSVPTPIGPLNLPEITLSKVTIQGRLNAGEFYLDNVLLGNSKDELYGTIKGKVQVKFRKRGVDVIPTFGRYEINIKLNATPKFEKKAGGFLGFIDSYKQRAIGYNVYAFKLSGANFNSKVNMTAP